MTSPIFQPLPDPPSGFRHYRKREEIARAPELLAYQHLLLNAWDKMGLCAVMTLNEVPTVYVIDENRPMESAAIAELHRDFWNQGLATVLLLREPGRFRVFSSMVKPISDDKVSEEEINARTVESLNLATQATWAEKFYLQLGTGYYYSKPENVGKFNPRETVDAYLIDNLEAVRDKLTSGPQALKATTAHAFLGRILFTCYLCHRGIVILKKYLAGNESSDLRELLANASSDEAHHLLYGKLFPALQDRLNSSMFDEDLEAESMAIKPVHLEVIEDFLEGSEIKKGQRYLGFWAYRFDFIPVETVSAIYEKFLGHEDDESKKNLGAYYTPRLLAEMTLDLALKGKASIGSLRFIDPSCGSGIFLVLAFNRLVAEWNSKRKRKPTIEARAEALLGILGQLRGVDKNPTACRISCFSLYLAFLNQFEPLDIDEYVDRIGKKLPNILVAENAKEPDVRVVWHRDFLEVAADWKGQFDIVVGNPPWKGRGSKQIANEFMEKSPDLLVQGGRAALVLPSKIFLNRTDEFQTRWLCNVTVETMLQLADYRFILFKDAICPASIVSFQPGKPASNHQIEFIAPKVTRTDLRDGLIPVAPQDRKWIPLSRLLEAGKNGTMGLEWKTRLWGTARDQKLLDYLLTFPDLAELVSQPSKHEDSLSKRWIAGQGCKPWNEASKSKPDRDLQDFGEWKATDRFVSPKQIKSVACVLDDERSTLLKHFTKKNAKKSYSLEKLYSKPPEPLFTPPLVLLNQGFSDASYSGFLVRFQDSLQSFTNPRGGDEEALLFLAAFLRSKLARYFQFHTAANLATERDKVHLDEVLRLPFFLPDSKDATKGSEGLFAQIVKAMKSEASRLEKSFTKAIKEATNGGQESWFEEADEAEIAKKLEKWTKSELIKGSEVRKSFDPLIYRYFNLTTQDIALVEDTCEIFDKGDTPGSLEAARTILTLTPIDQSDGLQPYADMICQTLNGWASGKMRVSAAGMADIDTGLALVELRQSKSEMSYSELKGASKVIEAAARLQEASKETVGKTLEFHRNGWFFDGTRILIVKPARLGEWTATSAINDAAALFAEISEARRLKNK